MNVPYLFHVDVTVLDCHLSICTGSRQNASGIARLEFSALQHQNVPYLVDAAVNSVHFQKSGNTADKAEVSQLVLVHFVVFQHRDGPYHAGVGAIDLDCQRNECTSCTILLFMMGWWGCLLYNKRMSRIPLMLVKMILTFKASRTLSAQYLFASWQRRG